MILSSLGRIVHWDLLDRREVTEYATSLGIQIATFFRSVRKPRMILWTFMLTTFMCLALIRPVFRSQLTTVGILKTSISTVVTLGNYIRVRKCCEPLLPF